MKITGVECTVLTVAEWNSAACDSSQDTIVVQVHTDEGITGIGEVDCNPWVIKTLIEAPGSHIMSLGIGELLMGQDPMQPESLWERLYVYSCMTGRRGAGICAIGAIDIAVWDIYGKAIGKPVWQLLGKAAHTHIVPYASLLPSGTSLPEYRKSLLQKAAWARDFGYSAVKAEICINGPYAHNHLNEPDEAIVELAAECRELIGPNVKLMLDVAYCWSDWKGALDVIRRLEKFDIFFVETPLPSDDLQGYAHLSDSTEVPIAAGEWLTTRYEFSDLISRGNVDVVQPDVGRVGGLTEALRVAKMALEGGKMVVPHCWKTGIGIAATAQLAAVTPNCPFIEFLPGPISESELRRQLVKDELSIAEGEIPLPQRAGLGIELNPEAVIRFNQTGSHVNIQPA